jgi:phage-related baseplate assembly protein
VLAVAQAALAAYRDDRSAGLGRDVVRSKIDATAHVEGVYSVAIAQPAASLMVGPDAWARCTALSVTMAGYAEG